MNCRLFFIFSPKIDQFRPKSLKNSHRSLVGRDGWVPMGVCQGVAMDSLSFTKARHALPFYALLAGSLRPFLPLQTSHAVRLCGFLDFAILIGSHDFHKAKICGPTRGALHQPKFEVRGNLNQS
jgi:hypothetical protein